MTDESDPNAAAVSLLEQAMAEHQHEHLTAADKLYQRVLELEPGNARALRLQGILARQLGDPERSLQLLLQAAAAAPAETEPLSELALTQMAAGDLLQADRTLRAVLTRDPESRRALSNLGALLQFRGHITEAIDCHQRALDLDPQDLGVRCNLARALVDAGRTEEALAECEQALSLSGGHPSPLAVKGAILIDLQQFDAATATLELAVERAPDDDMALVNLGCARAQLNQPEAAAEAWRRAVILNPDNARAVSELARARMNAGRTTDAQKLCEGFLLRHPGERLVLAAYAFALRDGANDHQSAQLLDYQNLIRCRDVTPPAGFESLPAFNHALTNVITGDPSLLAGPLSKATRAGGQTGELDFDSHPAFAGLRTLITEFVTASTTALRSAGFADHPAMLMADAPWILRGWGTVLEQDGHQIPHMHPLGWLSGVYYVQVPRDMDPGGEQAGWIEFGQPPDTGSVRNPELKTLEPRDGRLMLFPSYFYHCTRPFRSAQARISIAFDLVPRSALKLA